MRLVNIDDERFWDILFDEACVEGQQAERIKKELENIIAFDVDKVVERLQREYVYLQKEVIDIVRKGGVQ